MKIERGLALVMMMGAAACGSDVTGNGGGTSSGGASGGTSSGGTSGTSGSSGSYTTDPNAGATRPPPVITSASPLAGDYGTTVTIEGDNLDEASAELTLASPTGALSVPMPPPGSGGVAQPDQVVLSWSKTKIEFRYPFPADGAVGITTKSGQASGGTFVPSTRPGSGISGVFTRRELLSTVSPSAGTLVAAFDGDTGPQILVAKGDGTIDTKAYNRGSTKLTTMSLYVDGGSVGGLYAIGGSLYQLTDAIGAATTATTGVAALDAAGGADASGPYAWIRNANATLSQVRPPSWNASATVADPTPSNAPTPTLAVSPDGAVVAGWGVNDGGSFPTYDNTAWPDFRVMAAGTSSFGSTEQGGYGADDAMVWMRLHAGPGGRVFSYYCANNTGLFDPVGTLDCGEGYLGATGGIDEPTTASHAERVWGWDASSGFMSSCDAATSTLSVGPEADTASAKALLWPCARVIAVQPDTAGVPMILVQYGSYVYSPRPRQ
jgi:hypothetical protein